LQKYSLVEHLGIKIVKREQGLVVATMPVDDRTRQPLGFLHGGASVALAETVASVGAFDLIDQETEAAVGLEINANHVRGKRDGTVTATGTLLHRGRTTMVWDVRITDEEGRLICASRCTIAIIERTRN